MSRVNSEAVLTQSRIVKMSTEQLNCPPFDVEEDTITDEHIRGKTKERVKTAAASEHDIRLVLARPI